ncbi:MAG: Transaldolase [Acidimicrobiales bacterium]|nr:MAG: transaldolase [Actinomycetota bacterium]MBV6507288.1 Transaldolase [Acidimicrobiales bacterium]RIK04102.1 MAG: transaldolase [Acidobacteriota bacterium]
MSRIQQLYRSEGQSPWLDNLKRGWITGGEISRWVERGVRGITSNPTILQKAMESTDAYDEQLGDLVSAGEAISETYWDLVTSDIGDALDLLRPVHDSSGGSDGFVSVEVAPELARDTEGTIAAARTLHERIAKPNLLVKIPGTEEGLPAIRQMLSEGHSINVTLIFSLERYSEVMEAYLSGLEARDGDLSAVSSVASFFISRVDTETDRRLEALGNDEALALRGKAAVAQGKLAYQMFLDRFRGPRWEALEARGAKVQRPLWASTSTKNPAYPDTKYVDELIGPNTVNTLPDETLDLFDDHGTLGRTLDTDVGQAGADWEAVGRFVDMGDVGQTLEDEGLSAFGKSFDEVLSALATKAESFKT